MMYPINRARKLIRQARASYLWKKLLFRANSAGYFKDDLSRIREYIFTSIGFNKPKYELVDQRPNYYLPKIGAQPWYKHEDFNWAVTPLENSYSIIKEELNQLRLENRFINQPDGLSKPNHWSVLMLFMPEVKFEVNCARCPQTTSIVESIPGAISAGMWRFLFLAPGSAIAPHYGPVNTRIRIHLGLQIPSDCAIRVGVNTNNWEEGKCIILDDSFEHEAWNRSEHIRIIFMVDIWHPDLTKAEIFALREVNKLSGRVKLIRRKTGEG